VVSIFLRKRALGRAVVLNIRLRAHIRLLECAHPNAHSTCAMAILPWPQHERRLMQQPLFAAQSRHKAII
jgi:hypothetical protein